MEHYLSGLVKIILCLLLLALVQELAEVLLGLTVDHVEDHGAGNEQVGAVLQFLLVPESRSLDWNIVLVITEAKNILTRDNSLKV